MLVIATQREPLPAALGRSQPAAAGEARERALIRAAQAGSSAAVEELFRRHWAPAHRAAYLIVQDAAAAEDIAQEAFVAALRALDRFDRRRPFAPWLHRIVANRAIDWSRARAARREVHVEDEQAGGRADADPPSREVLVALAGLPPEQRAVVVLRHLLGYTPGQIARLLELPRGTVNSRLRRGARPARARAGGAVTRARRAARRSSRARRGCRLAPGARRRARHVCDTRGGAGAPAPLGAAARARSGTAVLLVGVAAASPGTETIIRSVREAVVPETVRHTTAPLEIPGDGSLLVRSRARSSSSARTARSCCSGPTATPRGRRTRASSSRPQDVISSRSIRNRRDPLDDHRRGARLRCALVARADGAAVLPDRYLGAGAVHVIAGDGTGDRTLAPADDRVAPAWRPRSRDRALAFVMPGGAVRVESVETGRDIARVREPFRPKAIAWSADGTRLLVLGVRQLVVLDLDGDRRTLRIAPKPGSTLASAAFLGDGHAIVLLRRLGGGRSRIVLVPARGPGRPLVTLVGTLAGLAPSPDGTHVLVGWSAAGQWLLVPVTGTDRARRTIALASRLGETPQLVPDSWR